MENLLSQFTTYSNQSLSDKNLDPSTIEDLMKLFEIESYRAWAAPMEHEETSKAESAHDQNYMIVSEDQYFESAGMESVMEEFRRFEEEMEKTLTNNEDDSLVSVAKDMMSKLIVKLSTVASKKYTEAALSSAATSVISAWKGISTAKKLHAS